MPTHHDILEESYIHTDTACLTTTHQAPINILFPALDGSHDTTTELIQRSGHCWWKEVLITHHRLWAAYSKLYV